MAKKDNSEVALLIEERNKLGKEYAGIAAEWVRQAEALRFRMAEIQQKTARVNMRIKEIKFPNGYPEEGV